MVTPPIRLYYYIDIGYVKISKRIGNSYLTDALLEKRIYVKEFTVFL